MEVDGGEKPAEQVLAEEEKVKQESQEHPVPISPDIEPDDEVIAEIDVHLSQDLANYLYIVQYPLRPPWRPYDPNNLKEIRFKPNRHILEMDYYVPSEELLAQRGTMRIIGSDGEVQSTPQDLKHYTVRSSVVPLKTNYVVGLYRDRTLYLTPVKGILQMRPSFKHIDEAHERAKAKKDEEAGESAAAAAAAAGDEEAKVITQEMQDEPILLDFVHRDDHLAQSTFQRLAKTTDVNVPLDVSPEEYLDLITPEESAKSTHAKK